MSESIYYRGIKRGERFCPVCDMNGTENIIENEERFLILYPFYNKSRRIFLTIHSQGRNRMIDFFKSDNVALPVDLAR